MKNTSFISDPKFVSRNVLVWLQAISACVLVFFAVLPILLSWYFEILPAEDAAILYRYSENLANGGIISYSPNGPKEEGATDFLWMLLLSIFYYSGIDPFESALALNGVGAAFFVIVLGVLSRKYNPLYLSVFCVLCATSIGAVSSLVGFATNFFYGLIAATFLALFSNRQRWFLFFCTVAALTRPEGIFVSSLLLVLHWLFYSKDRKKAFLNAVVGFVIPICTYWVWRTIYFENLIPLPLQIKVGTGSSFDLLLDELREYVFILLGLLLLSYAFKDKAIKETICFVGVFLLLFLMYGNSLLSQNVYNRFLFFGPFLASLAIANCIGNSSSTLVKSFAILALIYLLIAQVYSRQYFWNFHDAINESADTASSIGKALHNNGLNGFALVSEAGRFPYFSKWMTVDSWGLNSKQFTRSVIRPADVVRENYDLIYIHPSATQGDRIALDGPPHACIAWYESTESIREQEVKTWEAMIENILLGINPDKYELYLVPYLKDNKAFEEGRRARFDCYFLRKNATNFVAIQKILMHHNALAPEKFVRQRWPGNPPINNRPQK